jgi:hypothetical protein
MTSVYLGEKYKISPRESKREKQTMPNKNLPIQFFESRSQDERRTEGGGNSEELKWLLSQDLLIRKSAQLSAELDAFESLIQVREQQQSIIPFVFKAYMTDKATAKYKRQYVSKIFNTRQEQNNIIGVLDKEELIVRVSTLDEFRTISNRIKQYDTYQYGLSCLNRITAFTPFINKNDNQEKYKVHLLDFQNYEENESILRLFEKTLVNNNLIFQKTSYNAKNLPIYKIQGIQSVVLDILKDNNVFEALFSIEPMPTYSLSLDTLAFQETVPVMQPELGKKYETLGILDNGIAPISHLAPWLDGKRHSPYPADVIPATHGTFVAGVALYGDELEKSSWIGHRGIKLFDAAVYPNTDKESIDEDDLIENIREVIKLYHEKIKVWNLSISKTTPISETSFSDLGIFLDGIQAQYNILICKSVGNCDNFMSGRPRGKIHQGADSVLSLVVGSIAHKKSQYDISDVDNPSPFTRIGPGPEFIIKPEVAHYGGNAGIKPDGNATITGVKSFSYDDKLAEHAGTSHAAPRIAALVTGLYQEMENEFDPLLLKGLTIHSAEYPDSLTIPYIERTKYVGFGKPPAIADILYNDIHEITLVLRSTLVKGRYIDILDFPMPSCLIKDGFYTGQIISTLVYSPILNSTQGSEYCQSNINVYFGTYDSKTTRDISRRTVLNPIGRANPKNILLPELYSKRVTGSATGSFALQERLLIQYTDKYYPVKKYAVDLSELTVSNKRKYVTDKKFWFLKLEGLYRNFTEEQAMVHSERPSQEFCLIMTIRDPSSSLNIYDETIHSLDINNFWHSQIALSSQIAVRN